MERDELSEELPGPSMLLRQFIKESSWQLKLSNRIGHNEPPEKKGGGGGRAGLRWRPTGARGMRAERRRGGTRNGSTWRGWTDNGWRGMTDSWRPGRGGGEGEGANKYSTLFVSSYAFHLATVSLPPFLSSSSFSLSEKEVINE